MQIFYLEVVIDVMFMTDILMNFNTGFYEKGILFMRRDQIAKTYLKQWFWVDLISSLPFTWILAATQGIGIREIEADDNINGALASTP